MFRALLAHHQETPHKCRFVDYCVQLYMWVGLRIWEDQPTSTNAHNSHQSCIRVVSPDDGQVMPETCREFEPE
jgi:hypothetical protein